MSDLANFLNTPVVNVTQMRTKAKAGDLFGVELECEGVRVDYNPRDELQADLLIGWTPVRDGSLRDNHGTSCEWVFSTPVRYAKSAERITNLFKYFQEQKAKLVCSNRTSLHVHFNMSDKKAYQAINTFILFTLFEDILDRYCGEDRNGNLFCLSSRMAEGQLNNMIDACLVRHSFSRIQDNDRYCSLNFASLNKFGTVEFRGMRGLDNKDDVLRWLSIVSELCAYACYTMHNPVRIIEDVSIKTPSEFLKEVFSKDNYEALTRDLDIPTIDFSIYEGIRLVQMLCYQVGAEFDKVQKQGKDFWEMANEKYAQGPEEDVPEQPAPRVGWFEEFAQIDRNRNRNRVRPAPRLNPFEVNANFIMVDEDVPNNGPQF